MKEFTIYSVSLNYHNEVIFKTEIAIKETPAFFTLKSGKRIAKTSSYYDNFWFKSKQKAVNNAIKHFENENNSLNNKIKWNNNRIENLKNNL